MGFLGGLCTFWFTLIRENHDGWFVTGFLFYVL
ncbi:hypothetical protein LINPERPRIM_LOCUS42769 [Linum perenne]